MFAYIWPIALVLLSNTAYHICAKSAPEELNPLASLIVTYGVGALSSLILYYCLNKGGSLIREFGKLNWAPFALGLAIVGLEAGYLYAYRNGWEVSKAQTVQGAALAILLLFLGFFAYGEKLTPNKIIGVVVCLAGLVIMNWK